ncbi:histone-lysine_N-methyltransferase 2A-like isoform X2 [Hexamita inflata]|uniref:Histone-lysine_N-methyltransferase 2A-like isoform X2 n=1 Tax=Hexamita inflata TaxID=28002 RepID=A0ABP1GJ74_9EUKA
MYVWSISDIHMLMQASQSKITSKEKPSGMKLGINEEESSHSDHVIDFGVIVADHVQTEENSIIEKSVSNKQDRQFDTLRLRTEEISTQPEQTGELDRVMERNAQKNPTRLSQMQNNANDSEEKTDKKELPKMSSFTKTEPEKNQIEVKTNEKDGKWEKLELEQLDTFKAASNTRILGSMPEQYKRDLIGVINQETQTSSGIQEEQKLQHQIQSVNLELLNYQQLNKKMIKEEQDLVQQMKRLEAHNYAIKSQASIREKDLLQQISAFKQQLVDEQIKNSELKSQIGYLETDNEAISQQKIEYQTQIDKIATAKQSQIVQLQEQFEKQKQLQEQQHKQLVNQFSIEKELLLEKLQISLTQINALEQSNQDLSEIVLKQEQDIQQQKQIIQSQKNNYDQLIQQTKDKAQKDLVSLKSELDKLKQVPHEVEKEHLRNQLFSTQKEGEEYKQQVKQVQKVVQTQQAVIDELKKVRYQLEGQSKHNDQKTPEQKISELEGKILKELKDEKNRIHLLSKSLKEENEKQFSEIQKLQQQLFKAQEQNTSVTTQYNQLNKEYMKLKHIDMEIEETQYLNLKINELQTCNKQLNNQIEFLKKQIHQKDIDRDQVASRSYTRLAHQVRKVVAAKDFTKTLGIRGQNDE